LTQYFFETIFPQYNEPELALVDNFITGKLPCVVPNFIGLNIFYNEIKYQIQKF